MPHALDLTRADAITHTCAADPDLIRTLDLAGARALADAIARDLASAIDLARTRAVELADAIDARSERPQRLRLRPRSRHRTRPRPRRATSTEPTCSPAASPTTPILDLARVFGLTSVHALDPALPLPGVLGLPLRWIADGPLASTLLQVLAETSPSSPGARPLPGDPYLAFALALSLPSGDSRDHAAQGGPRQSAHRRAP